MYRIQEIGGKIDVPVSTIRYWQKEFIDFISPAKTNGGQRRYSDEDLSVLSKIKEMLHVQKKSVAEVRSLLGKGHSDSYDIDWSNKSILITGGTGSFGKHFLAPCLGFSTF